MLACVRALWWARLGAWQTGADGKLAYGEPTMANRHMVNWHMAKRRHIIKNAMFHLLRVITCPNEVALRMDSVFFWEGQDHQDWSFHLVWWDWEEDLVSEKVAPAIYQNMLQVTKFKKNQLWFSITIMSRYKTWSSLKIVLISIYKNGKPVCLSFVWTCVRTITPC